MNESEQQLDQLKQLLKLKRHEIPPPGYFNNFSNSVIAGIREERESSVSSRLAASTSFFGRFVQFFETRPGLVGGMATSLVLLLVFGVVIADHSDSETQNIYNTASAPNSSPLASVTVAANNNSSSAGGIAISTNPVTSLQPMATMFGQQNPLFQNASFAPAGN